MFSPAETARAEGQNAIDNNSNDCQPNTSGYSQPGAACTEPTPIFFNELSGLSYGDFEYLLRESVLLVEQIVV